MAGADLRIDMISLLPRLRLFAYSLTRSAADADDLVQSTCERALKASDTFAPGTRLDSWMFKIMRNHWIDHTRRRRSEGNVVHLSGEEAVPGEDGRAVIEARDEMAAVDRIILTLPEEQRSVLVLVCIEELSYRDAAAVLDVPIGTIMSRLSRARQHLAKALAEPGTQAAQPKATGGRS